MSLRDAGVVFLLLCATSAIAEPAAPAAVKQFKDAHQDSCVSAISAQVDRNGFELPFGYVDNFCACMGDALFGSMTVAEQMHFENTAADALPPSMARREGDSRERCAVATSALYLADY